MRASSSVSTCAVILRGRYSRPSWRITGTNPLGIGGHLLDIDSRRRLPGVLKPFGELQHRVPVVLAQVLGHAQQVRARLEAGLAPEPRDRPPVETAELAQLPARDGAAGLDALQHGWSAAERASYVLAGE